MPDGLCFASLGPQSTDVDYELDDTLQPELESASGPVCREQQVSPGTENCNQSTAGLGNRGGISRVVDLF